MNEIINKFLLNGNKFMEELHLKQPALTQSACGPFIKHNERFQKFRETGNLKHQYRNELEKACFAHDAPYSVSKDLAKITTSDKTLKDRVFEIARNCNYDGYQRALASIVYMFFDKKTISGSIPTSKASTSVNKQLTKKLHKPVIKKFNGIIFFKE